MGGLAVSQRNPVESKPIVLITLKPVSRLLLFVFKEPAAPLALQAPQMDDWGQKTEVKSLCLILENTVVEKPRMSSQLVQNI